MFRRLKLQWRDLKCAKQGTRFRRRYRLREQRGRSYFAKPLYTMVGFCLFVVGFVLLLAPGPGFLVGLIGAAMMAEESYWVASLLDRLEIRLRRLVSRTRRALSSASGTTRDSAEENARRAF